MRKIIIAGNWKMNNNNAETKEFLTSLISTIATPQCDVVLAVPFTSLYTAVTTAENSPINISAQNCHWEDKGAFTGETSVSMLKEIGVNYTLVGHSERRQYFGETDTTVNARTKAALAGGMTPIVCIGETLFEREENKTEEVCKVQLEKALDGVCEDGIKNVVIAYEPVWAIGTGKTATGDQAEDACKYIRQLVASIYNQEIADGISILYGGSMNEKNCDELLSKDNIDGGLIGGASLKVDIFTQLIDAGNKH